MKRIKVIPERCSGCRVCELACALAHFKVNNAKKAAIRVFSIYPNPIIRTPIVCRQCDEPACTEACPTGAIRMGEDLVELDRAQCIMCLKCVEQCPYGALFVHPEVDHPLKCDLCGGSPACVAACPTGALELVDGETGPQPLLVKGKIEYENMKELSPGTDGPGAPVRYVDGGKVIEG